MYSKLYRVLPLALALAHACLFLVGPRLVPPPSTTDDARIHLGALNGLPEGPSHDLREAAGRVRVAQGLRR